MMNLMLRICGLLINTDTNVLVLKIPILLFLLKAVTSYRYLPDRIAVSIGQNFNPVGIITDVPHHALIVYGSRYCSGSLIYSKIVVTAASCFVKHNEETVDIKMGASTITGIGQVIAVVEYKIHEYFKELSPLDNDIALLVLQKNVLYQAMVKKTLLVEPEVAIRENTDLMVAGWGGGTNMPMSYINLLLKLGAVVLKRSECVQYYGNLITPSNFCVRYTTEHFLTDNGGGAMFDDILVGILSLGVVQTNIRFNTAIVTNVSYFHRWITLNSKKFLKRYCTSVLQDIANASVQ